jgi:dCTP diphosphatase
MTISSSSRTPNSVRAFDEILANEEGRKVVDSPDRTRGKNERGESASSSLDLSSLVRTIVDGNNASEETLYPLHSVRSKILALSATVGRLCSLLLSDAPLDAPTALSEAPDFVSSEIKTCMGNVLVGLLQTAECLSLSLHTAILTKMELNRRKYPVHLCKGKAGKYTDYSESTGITKVEGQSTMKAKASDGTHDELPSEPAVSNKAFWTILPTLTRSIRMFATERDWSRYHKPRSLTLALLGELGELAELVQFRDDTLGVLTATQLDKLGQEIADVSIYLLRLADVFGTKMEEPSAGSR